MTSLTPQWAREMAVTCPFFLYTARGLALSATAQADGGARPEMVTSAGSGALPREIFFYDLGDFQAKTAYHTTYRTSLESSH